MSKWKLDAWNDGPETISRPSTEGVVSDIRALATQLMGWHPGGACWHDDAGPVAWMPNAGRDPWNPFTDANADLQVLERVREVWKAERFSRFSAALYRLARERWHLDAAGPSALTSWDCMLRYSAVGDYSRAALAVLRESEEG